MRRSQKRLLKLILGIPVLMFLLGIGYMLMMTHLEGVPRTFWESFQWSAETLSTTGYGADSRWTHPAMASYVVLVQILGIFVSFLVVPLFILPFLEERFEERVPRRTRETGHIVIFHYGPAVETLVDTLCTSRLPLVIVERDEQTARSLVDRDIPVVLTRGEDDDLEAGNILDARSLVVNGRDEENAGMILRSRQMGFKGDIYALVEEPAHRKPMEVAGATAVYTPRHILGAALAARASDRISPRVAGLNQIPGELEVAELRIAPDSPLAGKTLREAELGQSGATVIAQWINGKLRVESGPDCRLEPGGIVLIVGHPEQFSRLTRREEGIHLLRSRGPFLVAGFGEVGKKVHELLTDAGEEVRVIDRLQIEGVTLAGNVLDPYIFRAAGLEESQAVILALDSDDATLFATVIVRDAVPDAPIIARVNHARNVENIYRAGADFALSISQVSGQLLSYRLVGKEAMAKEAHLKIEKISGDGLAGRHPSEMSRGTDKPVTVLAIQRGKDLRSAFDPDFRIEDADVIYVCASS